MEELIQRTLDFWGPKYTEIGEKLTEQDAVEILDNMLGLIELLTDMDKRHNDIKELKSMLSKAVEWGYLFNNPAKSLSYIEITDAKPIRWLSEDEYRGFMEICKNEFKEYYPIFYTFVHTGMRRGEILGLDWPDIDFKAGIIHIRSKEGFKPKGIDASKQASQGTHNPNAR